MGSPAIAAWVAHILFWGLLVCGWVRDDLGARSIVAFLLFWVAGLYGLPFLTYGAALFSSFVAVLDVALVLLIFKGDIRLT
jgi:hypothetical protein